MTDEQMLALCGTITLCFGITANNLLLLLMAIVLFALSIIQPKKTDK